jgi:CheY-like chemotaxis protein/nitrogen-specific signal transduction histidine kinase
VNARLEENARELAHSREAYRAKALEAERTSRYKSEFLANVSHELRTPLNSTLILAKLLADNKHQNLSEEQVRFASTIHKSDNDLLALINDILDLSQAEGGHVTIRPTDVAISRVVEALERTFDPVAKQGGVAFRVERDPSAPERLVTDALRLEQILKNLLSNAFKFTHVGSVTLGVSRRDAMAVFSVTDTGIGVPDDQLDVIFEPFRQADGTTNRKYGGTGLGLSISRELAHLLGGELEVASEPSKGSVFRLVVPLEGAAAPIASIQPRRHIAPAEAPAVAAFLDDRATLDGASRSILVVEDDVPFARILYDLAHERGLQCIVAHDARTALELAKQHLPSAIVLDVNLPDHTGLHVLDQLKHDPKTRHVPVHVVSVSDQSEQALAMGAVGYLQKPVDRDALARAFGALEARVARGRRRLLIVEDDAVHLDSLVRVLAADDLEIVSVATVKAALEALAAQTFDCVVTDLGLPDESGLDLLERMAADPSYAFPPVIVYTGRKLTYEQEQRLRRFSTSVIVKGAHSLDRLLDEVSLFLHVVESRLPTAKQRLLRYARDRDGVFDGKTILVVEDDVRNVFALTKLLEPLGARVVIARNGLEALRTLETEPSVALVLMDIMMPEMDGLEAMREIRRLDAWKKTPIIALMAKAMPDDREECIRAGANDYVAKPIDVDMLVSLLRVWMPR